MLKIIIRFRKLLYYIIVGRKFLEFHVTSKIICPISITPQFIKIGKYVQIYHHCRIQGIQKTKQNKPVIQIGNNVSIQQNMHLTCAKAISIGSNTAIAANVTITDINHSYVDISIPVEKQPWEISPVEIGEDCKIYNNAVILPGTKLGKHNVVGANSVVSGIFPDFCVIVGIPASIIKRYNFQSKKWQKTNKFGEFIDE